MSTAKEPQPAKPDKAANNGLAAELDKEAIKALTGYFDVLIQMDLSQKIRKQLRSKENGRRNANKDR